MMLFHSAFATVLFSLALAASIVPRASAAPWWIMHYVMEEVPSCATISTLSASITTAVFPTASISAVNSASGNTTCSSTGHTMDVITQQSNGAAYMSSFGVASVFLGSAATIVCLVL